MRAEGANERRGEGDGAELHRPVPATGWTIDDVLLALGGERVIHQDDEFDDLLVRDGVLMRPKRIVLRRGRERNCHRNASGLYLFHYPDYRIATGYVLDDGIWFRHSWLLADDKLVETTRKFKRYFGVTLDAIQSAKFIVGDVIDTAPALAAVCQGKAGAPTAPATGAGDTAGEADESVLGRGDSDGEDAPDGDGGEILFRCLIDPVASWSLPGIRWAVEYWLAEMAYPVGQAWVHVTPYGPFLDWLYVMDDHRRAGIGTALLEAVHARWPDVVCVAVTEAGERLLGEFEGADGEPDQDEQEEGP